MFNQHMPITACYNVTFFSRKDEEANIEVDSPSNFKASVHGHVLNLLSGITFAEITKNQI